MTRSDFPPTPGGIYILRDPPPLFYEVHDGEVWGLTCSLIMSPSYLAEGHKRDVRGVTVDGFFCGFEFARAERLFFFLFLTSSLRLCMWSRKERRFSSFVGSCSFAWYSLARVIKVFCINLFIRIRVGETGNPCPPPFPLNLISFLSSYWNKALGLTPS